MSPYNTSPVIVASPFTRNEEPINPPFAVILAAVNAILLLAGANVAMVVLILVNDVINEFEPLLYFKSGHVILLAAVKKPQFTFPAVPIIKLESELLKVPEYIGLRNANFVFNAFCVAVLIGSADGDVLATFPNPKDVGVIAATEAAVASVESVLIKDVSLPPYKKSLLLTVP